ncbi:MAG: FtsX-like permease family protein [Acidobacteria bacterium]|nr:FtsX-like permease family protein [Acidobacteriota bacterium]
MTLLRLITWPYVRRHKLRTVLTTVGIVLGVAVFIGMHTANQSVLYAFYKTVDRIAGKAELQITAGEGGFPEAVLERVQGMPEVRVAVPVIEAPVDTGLKGEGNLLILAVDMTGDRSLRDYDLESGDDAVIDDPLVFLAQPDSLMVTREFAERTGISIGTKVPMRTMDGEKQFTVRGIMKSGGLTQAFGGNLAVMDIYAAQMVFGRGRTFDRVDLALNPGVSLAQGRAAIEQALGPGFQVEPPATRGQQIDSVIRVYSFTANINSAFALFIGMFIIYNSFSIAVAQRRREIGILRALGASRGQIRSLFLIESGLSGLVGSVVGLGCGVLLSRGLAVYISGLIAGVYGIAERTTEVARDPTLMIFGLMMGVVTSVVAGFIPARNAARVDPIQALQKGRGQKVTSGENRIRRIAALVLGVASAGLLTFGQGSMAVFYVGFAMAVVAMLLLSPTGALWLTRLLRPVLKWLRPVEGALAADSLIQSPRRTSATVTALMLSLALVVSLGGIATATVGSVMDWTTAALNPDLFVTASQSLTERNFRFPAALGDRLAVIEGVDLVQRVRSHRMFYKGTPVMLVAVEAKSLGDRARRPPVEGPPEMYELAAEGKGVILSDNFARLQGLHYRDVMDLPTPSGVRKVPIVGLVVDWSDQQGAILMDRANYVKWWSDDTVNVFRIYVKQGVAPMDVRQRIIDRFAGTQRLFVLTNREVKAWISGLTEQWLGLAYAQIAIAVLVAILGIVNTLTVSIIDRRRELGVLQAVGGLRNQIRHTIWMEAITIGVVGLALGFAVGSVTLHYILEMAKRDLTGMALPYTFPWKIAAWLVPLILGAAFVAALWPAESAVRGSLVEALEYE